MFSILLIIVDIINNSWKYLPFHGIVGIILTGLFYFICAVLGEKISGAVLVVPGVFIIVYLTILWLAGKKLEEKTLYDKHNEETKCCDKPNKIHKSPEPPPKKSCPPPPPPPCPEPVCKPPPACCEDEC